MRLCTYRGRKMEPIRISYRDNVAGAFGHVLRSSAIFYYRQSPTFRTTISFLNYWLIKRRLEVAIVASVRAMDGTLIKREPIPLAPNQVVNYQPNIDREIFEGSIEIEAFALRNMVIPYAAVVGVYESRDGIAAVHGYGRTYSAHEIEEERTIMQGEEACWSLRDRPGIRSFCAFHNGSQSAAPQICRLEILTAAGETLKAEIALPALNPYQTVKLYPDEYIDDLGLRLGGAMAQGALSFRLSNAFTRMLVGHERTDGTDFQVTHSNFNYSRHLTDAVDRPDQVAVMPVPGCGAAGKKVIVYAHSSPGHYRATGCGGTIEFSTGELVSINLPAEGDVLSFDRIDGLMPSRLVTGLVIPNDGRIENECSLGIVTPLEPRRRFLWTICAADEARSSRLILQDVAEVYGGIPTNAEIRLRLYSQSAAPPLAATQMASDLVGARQGTDLLAIFPKAREHLAGGLGYMTIESDYGGLLADILLDNVRGSRALEHSF